MLLDYLLDKFWLISTIGSVLLVLDMYLTIVGYRLSQEGYSEYFETEMYEMNPRYRDVIHNQTDLTIRDYIIRILIGTLPGLMVLVLNAPFIVNPEFLINLIIELVIGGFMLLYLMVNLNHLSNIFMFKYVRDNPNELSGTLKQSPSYSFVMTRRMYFQYLVIWCLVYILTSRIFFLGGVIELVILILFTFLWERNQSK